MYSAAFVVLRRLRRSHALYQPSLHMFFRQLPQPTTRGAELLTQLHQLMTYSPEFSGSDSDCPLVVKSEALRFDSLIHTQVHAVPQLHICRSQ
jgi:hypothetical protein